MRYSLIITTAVGDESVWGQVGGGTDVALENRRALLEDRILPAASEQHFSEIFLAGRPGDAADGFPNVRATHVRPRYRDRREAFHIRDVATAHATGDVLVYQTDDHMLAEDFLDRLKAVEEEWDVLTPRRVHGATGEELNNGKTDGYSGYHCNCFKRWVWAMVPFQTVELQAADVRMSGIWARDIGAVMLWPDEPHVIDVEMPAGVV